MSNDTHTHMIQHYPSHKPEPRSVLSRMECGTIIGIREGSFVAYGEDPRSQEGRAFRDDAHALEALRRVADNDVVACAEHLDLSKPLTARIMEVDGESRIARVQ